MCTWEIQRACSPITAFGRWLMWVGGLPYVRGPVYGGGLASAARKRRLARHGVLSVGSFARVRS